MTYLGYFELRKRSKWLETYECQNLGRIVIPKRIFLNYFPRNRKKRGICIADQSSDTYEMKWH